MSVRERCKKESEADREREGERERYKERKRETERGSAKHSIWYWLRENCLFRSKYSHLPQSSKSGVGGLKLFESRALKFNKKEVWIIIYIKKRGKRRVKEKSIGSMKCGDLIATQLFDQPHEHT